MATTKVMNEDKNGVYTRTDLSVTHKQIKCITIQPVKNQLQPLSGHFVSMQGGGGRTKLNAGRVQ
jgi:hypothetical protein